MTTTPLFQQIAESIRRAIISGALRPGDELPPVREMSAQWRCAPGTVQRAYQELAAAGLVVSRPGQGTRVTAPLPSAPSSPLRQAALVHRAESFLLSALAEGYTPDQVEGAVRQALDRWRGVAEARPAPPPNVLRFAGSHDPAVSVIAARCGTLMPGYILEIAFCGSLGGLIALAEGRAELAGCHLWDAETDTYNRPFVRRLLPGRRVALLTLAQRRLGLIVPPGNPQGLHDVGDLARPGLRFINRQAGAGTRVWLDAQLARLGIDPAHLQGYEHCVATHEEVARAVAEGDADVGLGVETAALSYGLGFVELTTERYDFAIPDTVWEMAPVQRLAAWLATDPARQVIGALGGYQTSATGRVEWVE
ncbi:MAG: hypothetical protein Kow00106_04240 [Anaerolineae bacterium]